MKKLMSVFMVLALTVSLMAGCAPKPAPAAPAAPEAPAVKTIGLALSTLNNPFFVTLKEGAEAKAKELGAELIVMDAQDDSAKQASQIEDLIQKKVGVILINPTDSDAAKTSVEKAIAAGIPVISVDRGVNGAEVVSHIASDNVAGGKMAGEALIEMVGENAKVVELEGIPGASATNDRGKGFNEAIAGKLEVVSKQPADFNRDKGFTVMQNILQSNKDIKGVFAHNDEMALGAVKALEAAGISGVTVIGFDAVDDAVAAVKEGKMKATVAQKPDMIGSLSVETAMKVLNGETVEKSVPVPLELVK